MDLRPALRLATSIVALGLLAAPPALGAESRPAPPPYFPETPADYSVGAQRAYRIAARVALVGAETGAGRRLETAIETKDGGTWQVGFKRDDVELVQVIVDGRSGAVREAWSGDQVAWPMARGYEGQFGHVLNSPWVWIPLSAVFALALIDWRRPLRIAHLDLLALLAFGVSHVFFNRGEIGVSVPLVYPVLAYLLARMVWLGWRGGEPLRPSLPAVWLALAAVVLIGLRVTANVADSGVIDVGYSGTVGADRIAHGDALYGDGEFPSDNPFGDTYGPANYFAYVPFELALPWSGEWDELPASHAAAIAFDLATIAGLFVCGRRLRPGGAGRDLGITLAFAWAAYPYTAFALQSNSNDTLLAASIVWSLALFAKPLARGVLLGLGVTAKFAPLILTPLYVAGERGIADRLAGARIGRVRSAAIVAAALAATVIVMLAHPAIDPGLATFWDRTLASQLDRSSPFSIWGQVGGIETLQTVALAAGAGLAVAVAFVPRRRSIAQIAALAAALLIALQLGVDHWFYLYITWFAGPALIALAIAKPVRAAADG